jgi:hypothetical protein
MKISNEAGFVPDIGEIDKSLEDIVDGIPSPLFQYLRLYFQKGLLIF